MFLEHCHAMHKILVLGMAGYLLQPAVHFADEFIYIVRIVRRCPFRLEFPDRQILQFHKTDQVQEVTPVLGLMMAHTDQLVYFSPEMMIKQIGFLRT